MRKKGFTIFELMVSMSIFIVFTTVAIGAFVSISHLKSLSSTIKESQQKLRISMEMISRLSRQSDAVEVSTNSLVLYFDEEGVRKSGSKFEIASSNLNYYECVALAAGSCSNWGNATDLLGGQIKVKDSSFTKEGTFPPSLKIFLSLDTPAENSVFYKDEFNLTNTVILENVK